MKYSIRRESGCAGHIDYLVTERGDNHGLTLEFARNWNIETHEVLILDRQIEAQILADRVGGEVSDVIGS